MTKAIQGNERGPGTNSTSKGKPRRGKIPQGERGGKRKNEQMCLGGFTRREGVRYLISGHKCSGGENAEGEFTDKERGGGKTKGN
jgi:hypothetical protein